MDDRDYYVGAALLLISYQLLRTENYSHEGKMPRVRQPRRKSQSFPQAISNPGAALFLEKRVWGISMIPANNM